MVKSNGNIQFGKEETQVDSIVVFEYVQDFPLEEGVGSFGLLA